MEMETPIDSDEHATSAPVQGSTQAQATATVQPQPGISATPKLQQIISAAVQTPQVVTGTPKLQQIIVANPQQNDAPSPKLQQIITAAIQQQPSTSASPQIKRISTAKLTPSQLQQMISASPQQFQVVSGVGSTQRLQQIVVTTTPQQTATPTTQFQHGNPQLLKTITTSTPVLQGVIASTQAQQGMKPVGQVLQGLKTAQMHGNIKSSTPQLQHIVKQTPQQLQNIKIAQAQLQQLKASSKSNVKSQSATGQTQHVKTVVSQPQTIKNVIPNQTSQSNATLQSAKPGSSVQGQGGKPGSLLQQTIKQTAAPILQQTIKQVQQAIKTSQGVAGSPQTGGKTVAGSQSKPQGITATPRLQQMVATPPKKKEKSHPPKPTCLGDIVGKLSQGSRHVKRFKEDRRNIAKAVKYLNYGAFGSYAPSYDSSFANLSKDESDLINGSYGEFEPSDQIKTIISKDCDYTFTLADNLIEMFGGSTKKIKVEETIDDSVDESLYIDSKEGILPKTEEEELQTLSALGIDLTHLASLEYSLSKDDGGSPEVQEKLEITNGLIQRLQQMQYERLSVNPHPRLGHQIPSPSDAEIDLAKEITKNLATLTKQVPPGALVVDQVRALK